MGEIQVWYFQNILDAYSYSKNGRDEIQIWNGGWLPTENQSLTTSQLCIVQLTWNFEGRKQSRMQSGLLT